MISIGLSATFAFWDVDASFIGKAVFKEVKLSSLANLIEVGVNNHFVFRFINAEDIKQTSIPSVS
jgi:hypothetical protein